MLIDAFRAQCRDGSLQPLAYAALELKPHSPHALPVWVALERDIQVVWSHDRTSIEEASIRLSFERCDSARMHHGPIDTADFYGHYDARKQRVSITGRRLGAGAVYLPEDLRGLHLGSFAMSEVVRWAKQWPHAQVESISLAPGDAYPENRQRRNRLYEQFGIVFDYDDDRRSAGRSRPMRAGDLSDCDTWRAWVAEHPLLEAFAKQVQRGDDAERKTRFRQRAVENLSGRLDWAAQYPIRACSQRLWALHAGKAFWILFAALLVWSA